MISGAGEQTQWRSAQLCIPAHQDTTAAAAAARLSTSGGLFFRKMQPSCVALKHKIKQNKKELTTLTHVTLSCLDVQRCTMRSSFKTQLLSPGIMWHLHWCQWAYLSPREVGYENLIFIFVRSAHFHFHSVFFRADWVSFRLSDPLDFCYDKSERQNGLSSVENKDLVPFQ